MKSAPETPATPASGEPARPVLLHQYFARSVARWPSAVAIDIPPGPGRAHRRTVTYAELDRQSDVLARRLRPHLAGECVVAILADRQSELLYAAQIASLKAGAAHTCIDPSAPDGQVLEILADSAAAVLLADAAGAGRVRSLAPDTPVVIDAADALGRSPERIGPPPAPPWLSHEALAYVIYTSGTTGRPKGVMIEHRSIASLVEGDLGEFGVGPGDRVGQGSSPAYDSSVEETWLALAAGATLVAIGPDVLRLGPDLVPWLRRERVTVLCPPPTLLRTMACDAPASALPDLRLLYVGGEALPQDLADRWAPGRRLVNGYGPTEVTVTSVRGDVVAGAPVSIGRAVERLTAWVLDEAGEEAGDGEPGELCLGGAGLARGYWRQPDLTARRFPTHPRLGRIFRTGDLAHRAADGTLYCHGRIDSQVKLRGYRIELEAVEARLGECAGVLAAACAIQGEGAHQKLVAFVVPSDLARPLAEEALKGVLAAGLPPYMVPSRIVAIDELPTTVSGKLDQKRLPAVDVVAPHRSALAQPPRDSLEAAIADAVREVLALREPVSIHDDFFDDLGGDSLRAAMLVSRLRGQPASSAANVRDVYEGRTVAELARRLRRAAHQEATPETTQNVRLGRPGLVALAQAAWLAAEVVAGSVIVYAGLFRALPRLAEALGATFTLLAAPLLLLLLASLYTPCAVLLVVAAKRVFVGRYRPQRSPAWSSAHLRIWIVQALARLVPWRLFAGTEFHNIALRALGARIGRRVHIHRGVDLSQGGWDLLDIGDDASIGQDVAIRLVDVEDGHVVIGPVSIGARATLEVRTGVGPHATLEAESVLAALSSLPAGARIPRGERWDGVPARPAGPAPPAPGVSDAGRALGPVRYGVALAISGFVLRLALIGPLAGLAFGALLLTGLDVDVALRRLLSDALPPAGVILVSAAVTLAVPLTLALQAGLVRAMGRVRGGVIDRWSWSYLRIWLKTGQVESAGRWLSGTLLWPVWLRAAGMRVGPDCEVSTIIDVVPELVEIGPESFLADGIYLGSPAVHRGRVTLGPLRLGRNTFIGNHAVVACGQELPDDVLIGVCTVADQRLVRPGTSWFGQPPFELPRREVAACDRRLTHDPPPIRVLNRWTWECLRFALPVVPALLAIGWCRAVVSAAGSWASPQLVLVAVPTLVTAAGASLCALVLALKWLLLGRVRPGSHPLWSCWCSRWDFLYVAWNMYARGTLVLLEGSVWLTWYLRAMGMRIGRRVVLGAGFAQVVDPDMIDIEDDATVSAAFQAHTFEDRVLKIDRVHVRRGATLAAGVVPLYGADVGSHAYVAPHSVIMKRERLLPGVRYEGAPTRLQVAASPT